MADAQGGAGIVSESLLSHRSRNVDVVVTTSVSSSTSLTCGDVAGGVVVISGVTASATLTVWGAPSAGGTFAPVFDADGAAATLVVAADGGAVVLPDTVYALRHLKLTSDSDLGTAATFVVMLKS
jgi:hypothetical protein